MLGGTEILIIGGAIVGVCFGGKILKSWGTGLGESIREVRKIKQELDAPLTIDEKSDTGHPLPVKKGK